MEQQVYLNGGMVPVSQARISLLDYGFLFGYSLFETMRSYSGRVFLLDRHLERLAGSAGALSLPLKPIEWKRAVTEVLRVNQLQDARVRLILSAGPGNLVPDLGTCAHPTLCALAVPYLPPPAEAYERGYSVMISTLRRNSQSLVPGFKTSNFLESLLAKQEARRAGADDALLLNDRGLVAEASSSNVFIVKGGKLLTPRLGSGLLPGVTRAAILGLAGKLAIPAAAVDLTLQDLMAADEVFLSNSMIEIMPVSRIDGQAVGNGRAGAFSLKLLSAYRAAAQGS